jgi:pyrroline-5-carboxylate reductase
LADGGVGVGLTKEESLKLAIHTVLGSAQTVKTSGIDPETLKNMVASPGGTTIEGIQSLEKNMFRSVVMQAIEAAKKKADILGGK